MHDLAEQTAAWRSQLRKGSLELAVLLALRAAPRYGLALVEHLNAEGLGVAEGSIYPLLARLRGEEKVVAAWEDEGQGHAHKVYRLTRRGEATCVAMVDAWREFALGMERMIGGKR